MLRSGISTWIIFACLLAYAAEAAEEALDASWKEAKGKHFIVRYAGSEKFAGDVLVEAEKLYSAITERLGFKRYDNYWLWDDRATIWIYASREAFVKTENAPDWAAGKASVKRREIKAFETDARFLVSVLPHEMSHLIFREFTGMGSEVPLWLDEGVAQLQEKDAKTTLPLLRDAALRGELMPLKALMQMKPEKMAGMGPAVFYAESLSLVDYIITRHGSSSFRKFCGALKEGKGMDDALRFTYPGSIRSIEELERAWLKHLEESK